MIDVVLSILVRIRDLLLSPGTEWRKIAREPDDPVPLLFRYVALLALIPPLCGFIGSSLIGVTVSVGTFRVPLLAGLLNAVIGYLFTFVIVYVVALAADLLAPFFYSERHFPRALKLSAYSFTPIWLAGVFLLVPGLTFLSILGLYGIYLLWRGLPPLMECPRDRALLYTASLVLITLIVVMALAVLQSVVATLPSA